SIRDQLGNRTLFYGWHGTCLLIATAPWPVAHVIHGSARLDENGLAHFFAIDPSPDGQTLFKGVKELLPAHMMKVNRSAVVHNCYWEPDLSQKLRYKHDDEYSDHFLDLLEKSVNNCLRSDGKVGLLMSGGMDSTSVAALAARMIEPERLDTFSFVFNELMDCDEKYPILEVQKQWDLDSRLIPCDNLWPFKDMAALPFNPNFPEVNLYRQLKERIYQAASNAGINVLLTGGFGDHLYDKEGDWLLDLFLDGKIISAGRKMLHQVRDQGWKRFLLSGNVRRLVRHLVTPFRGNKDRTSGRKPGWLTEYSHGLLSKEIFDSACYPGSYPSMLGLLASQSTTIENFPAGRYGLELRHPFRDLRLLEFVLSIPAYQLIRNEQKKYILRNAMKGILPESVRTMPKIVTLNSLYKRGVEVEGAKIESRLNEPGGQWKKYVRPEWVKDYWQLGQVSDGPGSLLPWLCISFESWYKLLG
ncbi:MAG TPA: asparagine synthetase B family protein, partial [Anaerolineales bacterium]|nr:asparagine synthetase B family protein [Anaerolineales bacterium]